jgi:aminoglycoside phosphotransferase (APT) family kinase protein
VKEALAREQVAAFLAGLHGRSVEGLERLVGGFWSSAWAYRVGDEELVLRFGGERSWYEADRAAIGFSSSDLPVPEVREVGTAPELGAYALSVRHRGQFLEDTPVEMATALAATLTRLLIALRAVPAAADGPVVWHEPATSVRSWREFLLAGLADESGELVPGWKAELAADPRLAALSAAVTDRIRTLVDACPERRDLVHGDLLHSNVLVSPQADRVEAVFSWKCSVRGDFLFDGAWCSFWAPWHAGVAAADPLAGLLAAPSVRADAGALLDASSRHHCYELHIGFTHLGWNISTGNRAELDKTTRRLTEVFERGPLLLRGDHVQAGGTPRSDGGS